jgi:intracellular multiplication protein IcmJ
MGIVDSRAGERNTAGSTKLSLRVAPPPLRPLTGVVRPSSDAGIAPSVQRAVFERDHYTCKFCGFTALRHQEIVLLSGDLRDVDAMSTACAFCHQCQDLEAAARQQSGCLVWLPEIDQAILHDVARAVYIGRISARPSKATAQRIVDILTGSRRQAAQLHLGTDDPGVLAQRMRDPATDQAALRESLVNIRLWPLGRCIVSRGELGFNTFPEMLGSWRSPKGAVSPEAVERCIDYAVARLLTAEERAAIAFSSPPPDDGVPVTQLAADLLQDAARFYRTLARENPEIESIRETAETYLRVAHYMTTSPHETPPRSSAPETYSTLAIQLLRDSARFFRKLAGQNAPIESQMEQNAAIYEQIATMLETNPKQFMPR